MSAKDALLLTNSGNPRKRSGDHGSGSTTCCWSWNLFSCCFPSSSKQNYRAEQEDDHTLDITENSEEDEHHLLNHYNDRQRHHNSGIITEQHGDELGHFLDAKQETKEEDHLAAAAATHNKSFTQELLNALMGIFFLNYLLDVFGKQRKQPKLLMAASSADGSDEKKKNV